MKSSQKRLLFAVNFNNFVDELKLLVKTPRAVGPPDRGLWCPEGALTVPKSRDAGLQERSAAREAIRGHPRAHEGAKDRFGCRT